MPAGTLHLHLKAGAFFSERSEQTESVYGKSEYIVRASCGFLLRASILGQEG